jgi:hypothetical protein
LVMDLRVGVLRQAGTTEPSDGDRGSGDAGELSVGECE